MSAYYLVLVIITGRGPAIEHVPMQDLQRCQAAAEQFKEGEGTLNRYEAYCFKARD